MKIHLVGEPYVLYVDRFKHFNILLHLHLYLSYNQYDQYNTLLILLCYDQLDHKKEGNQLFEKTFIIH